MSSIKILIISFFLCIYNVSLGYSDETVPRFFGIGGEEVAMDDMRLEVNAFRNNQRISSMYTCDGDNVSPEISWSSMPQGTESLAFTIIDSDAPGGDFAHWLVYDIDPKAGSIPRGGPLPIGAKELKNDFGKQSYGGPCPPQGEHHYFFRLYALDVKYLENATRENFLSFLQQHVIDSVDVLGVYSKSR